jgi:hypothetical protein
MVIGYCGKVPRNTGIDPDAPGATEFTYKGTVQPQPKLGAWLPILEREAKLPKWERHSTASIGPCKPFACRRILHRLFVECAVSHGIDNRGRRGPLVTFGAVFRLSRSQAFSVA